LKNKLCIFAGTTEGRALAEHLADQPLSVTVCVATEYGEALLPKAENLTVRTGRMDQEEMADFFRREGFSLVVDATHPYAAAVTENIGSACVSAGTEYLRLLRDGGEEAEDAVYVESPQAAAAYLEGTQGNILLTTGSKELSCFSRLAERVYARVLPMEDSLRLCREAGLPGKRILAMQGPFPREMNEAMIRFAQAAFLVTKDSGTAGGFREKAEAARGQNCRMVVIGRPQQKAGRNYDETLKLLKERFSLNIQTKVTLVGIGTGAAGSLTAEGAQALTEADCLIGARRMLALARPDQLTLEAVGPEKIAAFIRAHGDGRRIAVALSGDTGFYSGAKKLLPLLTGCAVTVLPGISSLSCLCARLGKSYEDVVSVSLHGREGDICRTVRRHRRVFVLTGGENGLTDVCRRLTEAGLGDTTVSAGENLGASQETITVGPARELAERAFSSLTCALIENPGGGDRPLFGLPEEAFFRAEGVPMTKSEVRAVALSKLALDPDAVCWDIGAGSGSVTVEMALAAREVWAVERKEQALAVLKENCRRFHLDNVTVVPGTAPEACLALPAPTHVFLGGSGGEFREIIDLAVAKNPRVRIVAAAVTLETMGEAARAMAEFAEAEAVCLNVAKARSLGGYQLMTGQNPVYLYTMQGVK